MEKTLNGKTDETTQVMTTVWEIDAAAQVIHDMLLAQGRPTRDEIRAYCKEAGIETPLYQKAMERLNRQLNIITEVTNEDGKKAWALKEWARKPISIKEIVEIGMNIHGESKPRETYGDWYQVKGKFRLTSPCLASNPDLSDTSVRLFLRSGESVLLLSGYFDAMTKHAAQKAGAPVLGNARYRIEWDEVMMPESAVSILLRPVPPSRPGGSGQGVTSCECFMPDTEIPFSATVPGSHVSPSDMEVLLALAGRKVGFSPSSAHKGFGRFVPTIE